MPTTAIKPGLGSLLQAILTTAPTVAREVGLPRNWCLTAAGLVQSILAKHGFDGVRVLGVDFTAFNMPAWDLFTRGVPATHWRRCASPALVFRLRCGRHAEPTAASGTVESLADVALASRSELRAGKVTAP